MHTIEIGDIVYAKHTGDWGYVIATKIVAQYHTLTGKPLEREIGYRVEWFNDREPQTHRAYWYSQDSLWKWDTYEGQKNRQLDK
jgi:hypothetical protein